MTRADLLLFIVVGSLLGYVFGRLVYERVVKPYLQEGLLTLLSFVGVVVAVFAFLRAAAALVSLAG